MKQRLLLGWGYLVANRIFRVNRTRYQVAIGGNISPESGTSSDYAFDKYQLPVAYTIKLPSGGVSGYEVPASRLDAILSETFEGFLAVTKIPIF